MVMYNAKPQRTLRRLGLSKKPHYGEAIKT
jgi:hypothetical protein